jgi:Leucyl-tRNA synthetase
MGPFGAACAWNTNGLTGARKFLDRVWMIADSFCHSEPLARNLLKEVGGAQEVSDPCLPDRQASRGAQDDKTVKSLLHKTIKKVTEDIADFKFNTCISALMIFSNALEEYCRNAKSCVPTDVLTPFIQILAPFAPHLAEEIWREKLGNKESIFSSESASRDSDGTSGSGWPQFDPELIKDETINLVVQINGKLRATILVPAEISQDEAMKLVAENENVKKWLFEREVMKIIFVPGKLLNIVIK